MSSVETPKRIEPKVAKYLAMTMAFLGPSLFKQHGISDNVAEAAIYSITAIWLGADLVGLGFAFKTLKSKELETGLKPGGSDGKSV